MKGIIIANVYESKKGEKTDLLERDGIYICPECRGKRIMEISQNVLIKMKNVNTGKTVNPETGKTYMSNREKARQYDSATGDGMGCYYYECMRCGWKSRMFVE